VGFNNERQELWRDYGRESLAKLPACSSTGAKVDRVCSRRLRHGMVFEGIVNVLQASFWVLAGNNPVVKDHGAVPEGRAY